MTDVKWVEKPPHVDPVRMRHISDAELWRSMDLSRPLLQAVAAAVQAEDWPGAATAWQSYWAGRHRPAPHLNIPGWAVAVTGTKVAAETIERAEAALVRQVDFTDKGLGKSGLYGFHYLGWMAPLVYAYALTGDERYVAGWTRLFDRWYATRDLVEGDWPGLDVIWYTLGVGGRSSTIQQALHTFRASATLPHGTHVNMIKTILGGARWLCEEHDAFRYGNWQLAGCGELLQVAGVLPEFREAGEWEATARARLEDHLALDVYPDGGHHERCPSYHTMCLEVLKKAAIISEQCLGWRLSDHPRFASMYDWLLEMTTGSGWVPPFNDSHMVWSGNYLLWGHYFLGKPEYKGLALQVMTAEQIRATLGWLYPRPGQGDPAAVFAAAAALLPTSGSRLLATSKFALLRAGWAPEDLYAAISYGPFIGHELEPHSHLAGLDFVLAGSAPLAYEAGGPDTYDDPLYYDWYRATRAHNTVLVRGQNTGEHRDAELLQFAALPVVDLFQARHSGNPGVAHTRTVLFVRPEAGDGAAPGAYWFIHDELTGEGPFQWLLHGRTPWVVEEGGRCHSAEAPGLLVLPAAPERITQLTFSTGPSRIPDPQARETRQGEIHALSYHQEHGEYAVALLPFAGQAPAARLGSDGEGWRLDLEPYVDYLQRHQWVRTLRGRMHAAAVWGATALRHAGQTLVEAEHLTACSLAWQGSRLHVVAEASAHTDLLLRASGAKGILLEGVRIPPRLIGETLALTLPCAGRYHIEIDLEGWA